jgi:hypothetical protein
MRTWGIRGRYGSISLQQKGLFFRKAIRDNTSTGAVR